MRTRILRVVVLLSAFSFPSFVGGQTRNATPSVAANEASARLILWATRPDSDNPYEGAVLRIHPLRLLQSASAASVPPVRFIVE